MKTKYLNVLNSLVIVFLFYGCKTNDAKLVLTGEVSDSKSDVLYLQKFDDRIFRTIDSVEIQNGQFRFDLNIELPEIYGLSTEKNERSFMVFLDEGNIHIYLNAESNYQNSTVKGSNLHDQFVEYRTLENVDIEEYIKQYPNSLVSAYALYRFFSFRLPPEDLKANIQLLDVSLHETQYVKIMQRLLEVSEHVAIGRNTPDFSATTPDKEVVFLSEKLGENYLLIEFWASWCVFCRRENPYLVEAYKQYGDKGFDIFGVSLDRNHEAWVYAIEEDQLTWTNVSDLKFWASEPAALYGVRALPSNFLVDPDGIIIAQNLKGDDLINYLKELLIDR